MEENYNATSRKGNESQDMYDPEKPTARKIVYTSVRDNKLCLKAL